ncbi:YdcF family protein [Carnobacterium gallinarum]|uniref:YdcF family protein n=1 Tax=Carnobacterium gallinarum TaxID=2749 RepID=UPI00054D3AE2|nr:YdcF family protein [Carnobacterium gallinarum]
MIVLLFFLFLSLIGFLVLKVQNRSIVGGIILAAGLISSIISLFFIGINEIHNRVQYGDLIALGLAYVVVPMLFIGICIYFILNSKTMSTREGKSVTAKLSAALGLNLLIVLPLFFYVLTIAVLKLPPLIFSIIIFFLLVDLILTFLFAAYVLYSWMYQMIPLKKAVDFIIVLGSGIRSEDVPPLLKSRLDKGIEYYLKNPKAKLIVSGGQGPDEPVSEAFAMKKYLLSQNIPEQHILVEDRSTTTYENMLYSKKIIEQDWQEKTSPSIIFSTNNYHVLRGSLYAHKVHLKAEGVGAPTALYFLPTALIREYIALLVHHKILISLVVIFVFLLLFFSYLPF